MSRHFHIQPRIHNARSIIGVRSRENDQNWGLQLGLTTFGTDEPTGDETYQVSYVEWSARMDHLSDKVDELQGDDVPVRRVADADADDRIYVGTPESNERARAKREKAKSKD